MRLFVSSIPVLELLQRINSAFLTGFYRVERSRTRSRLYGGGTGLGLAIALTIIKAHKGGIELESELNKGSTFTIRLPIVEKDGKPVSSAVLSATDPAHWYSKIVQQGTGESSGS